MLLSCVKSIKIKLSEGLDLGRSRVGPVEEVVEGRVQRVVVRLLVVALGRHPLRAPPRVVPLAPLRPVLVLAQRLELPPRGE